MATDIVILDRDGDLYLTVGEREEDDILPNFPEVDGRTSPPQTFRVCSRALSRVSSVFKAMLNGPWVESRPDNASNSRDWPHHDLEPKDWTVSLPSDNSESLGTLLAITHNKYDLLPDKKEMEVHILFRLLVVANKYDMAHLIPPWSDVWFDVNQMKSPVFHEQSVINLELIVQISWELGASEVYQAAIATLAMQCDATQVEVVGDVCDYFQLPELKPTVKRIREEALLKAASVLRSFMDAFDQFPAVLCDHNCDSMIIGDFYRRLANEERLLLAGGDHREYPHSFRNIYGKLLLMRFSHPDHCTNRARVKKLDPRRRLMNTRHLLLGGGVGEAILTEDEASRLLKQREKYNLRWSDQELAWPVEW